VRDRIPLRRHDERAGLELRDHLVRRRASRHAKHRIVGIEHHALLFQTQVLSHKRLRAKADIRLEFGDHFVRHISGPGGRHC
jgi:hypothetical protein